MKDVDESGKVSRELTREVEALTLTFFTSHVQNHQTPWRLHTGSNLCCPKNVARKVARDVL